MYWATCGLTRHFEVCHLVDHLQGDFREERLLQLEKNWIVNMGTFGPLGVNTQDQERLGPAHGFIPFCGIANSNGSLTLEFFYCLLFSSMLNLDMIMWICHAEVIAIVIVVTKLKVE